MLCISNSKIIGIKENKVKTVPVTTTLCYLQPYVWGLNQWKSKFGGVDVNDVAKMRSLRDENGRRKRIFADLVLERDTLKNVAEGNFCLDRDGRGSSSTIKFPYCIGS